MALLSKIVVIDVPVAAGQEIVIEVSKKMPLSPTYIGQHTLIVENCSEVKILTYTVLPETP